MRWITESKWRACKNKVSYLLDQAAQVSQSLSACELRDWVVEMTITFTSAMTTSSER
jgi:hypothetical protein